MKNYIETDTITENADGETVTEVTETAEAAETEKKTAKPAKSKNPSKSAKSADAGDAAEADAEVRPDDNKPADGKTADGKPVKNEMQELIERAKAKGSVSNSEIMTAIGDDYDIDVVDKLYETLETMGVDITECFDDVDDIADDDIENDIESYESAENMEQILAQEGLAIDDPVKMYLKEIGKVPLLDPEREQELSKRMSEGDEAAKQEIFDELEKPYISGITFSGGDPLHTKNRKETGELINEIKSRYPDKNIWVYTGYEWQDVKQLPFMENVDVLVDGRFVEALKDVQLPWKGSSNQKVIDVAQSLKLGKIVLLTK